MPGSVLLCEVNKGHNLQEVVDELPIEVPKAGKSPQLFQGAWNRRIAYASKFYEVHCDVTGLKNKTKEFNLSDVNVAFLRFYIEIVFAEVLEDLADVILVCSNVGRMGIGNALPNQLSACGKCPRSYLLTDDFARCSLAHLLPHLRTKILLMKASSAIISVGIEFFVRSNKVFFFTLSPG